MEPSDLVNVSPWLWEMIEAAHRDRKAMKAILDGLDREKLERFHSEFEWAIAGLVLNEYADVHGYGRDDMTELAGWIVSQGLVSYARIYDQPNLLPRLDDIDSSEGFDGLAGEVYWQRFGTSIPHCG
jgi:hypothetical protein